MKKCLTILFIIFLSSASCLQAQIGDIEEPWYSQMDTAKMNYHKPEYLQINEEKILELFDRQPNFGIYKENYIITGAPFDKEISKNTADVKFQVSIRQRLTKTVLPFNTFLMLTYTQKSFWKLYKQSAPFEDNNYNPGLGLWKPIIYKNQFLGMASLTLEHESNGKDSIDSRGWNYAVLSMIYFFNPCFSVQAKVWGGILDRGDPDLIGGGNLDLYKYRGYGLIAFNYRSLKDKFWVSAIINPRTKFGDFNTQVELHFKMGSKANQYFFVQWYNGYAESLSEYNRYTSVIRIGMCINSPFRNFY